MSQPPNSQPGARTSSSRPPNFNRLAGPYRWMERLSFGPWLAWCRFAFLAEATACRRALVLGDGDGRFTARLLRANPHVHIDAVDASSAMLQALARRAGPHAGRLRAYLADARDWDPASVPPNTLGASSPALSLSMGPDSETSDARNTVRADSERPPHRRWDLIATHFFLDCLTTEEIQSLATRLRPCVSPNALWLVSEFAIPSGWYGRFIARPLIGALYRAFGLLTGLAVRTLPNHAAALRAGGFTLLERRPRLAGLLVSELWSATPPKSA
jgi:SAM-dependent methyltransferase